MNLTKEAERIIEDFKHGHKLGQASTERLLDLVLNLSRQVDYLNKQRTRTREDHV